MNESWPSQEKPTNENQRILSELQTNISNYENAPDSKIMELKLGEEKIGSMLFIQNKREGTLKISELGLSPSYQGLGIGIRFYEELITYAKENHFTKIKSGFSVKGGALVAWIKLSEKYKVTVNPKIRGYNFDDLDLLEENVDFNKVVQIYKDKKLPFDYPLSTSPKESVFELIVE